MSCDHGGSSEYVLRYNGIADVHILRLKSASGALVHYVRYLIED